MLDDLDVEDFEDVIDILFVVSKLYGCKNGIVCN